MWTFLKLSIVAFVIFCYGKGNVIIRLDNSSFSFSIVSLALLYGSFLSFYKIILNFSSKIFPGKSRIEKGLDSLQSAFFSMLMKDKSSLEKFIAKSRRYLGDIPIISWIEGQRNLLNGNIHQAKAIFYSLCHKETNTALGAYGLCQLAVKERSDDDTINAINSILKKNPSQDLALQAIAILVKNKNFFEAKSYLPLIKKMRKYSLIEAIVYSEEGFYKKEPKLLKKAFKLAPELSSNAIGYASFLAENEEYRNARRILEKTFQIFPNQELFHKYISLEQNLSISDKIKLAKKLVDANPNSWIGYFELAKLLIQNEMFAAAFQNLKIAYEKEQYDFIGRELIKTAQNLENPKPPEAMDILSTPLKTKHIDFVWRCGYCGAQENNWIAVCKCCSRIAEYNLAAAESLPSSWVR